MSLNIVVRRTTEERLAEGYRECEKVARRQARNFYYSFLLLPRRERLAMCALYAFLRKTDDIGDGSIAVEVRRENLRRWRNRFRDRDRETGVEAWFLAFLDTMDRFSIPPSLIEAVIDGVESDLEFREYETFAELYRYCYRVASAVGLACIRIWGAADPAADLPAEWCGIAFQLTNILRDVTEDYRSGRVYLPQDDLRRFGVKPGDLITLPAQRPFLELMQFEISRAEDYYQRARALTVYLPADRQAVFDVMWGLYHDLLRKIALRPERVLRSRVRLGFHQKIGHVIRALPRTFFNR